jgi:nicotinate phosphoribosyltransferase
VTTAPAGPARPSTGLLTDRYELTMLRGALRSGVAGRRSVFEVFARYLPHGRRYGVVAGTGRLLEALAAFRFDADQLDFLRSAGIADEAALDFLRSYRFSGSIWGYAEGDCYFPGSPILVVEGTFAEAVILETLALSILNHDCAVAAAGSRMVLAARGRPLIEMGSRRTHEQAAVAAARAAYIAGFATTSNLQAGHQYAIPTSGTSAHAFTLVHDDERQAFAAQADALGAGTTLLVDTYDVAAAVAAAVEVVGPGLGAVRIDSGDLAVTAGEVRAQLDALGATKTRIVLTGDLEEHSIAALAAAPADGYGVGTSLVTGSGAPTAALVYKLVARDGGDGGPLVPVAKRSVGKPSRGGRKWAAREIGADGTAVAEHITDTPPDVPPGSPAGDEPGAARPPAADAPAGAVLRRPLLRLLVRDGEIVGDEPVEAARRRHRAAVEELPGHARQLSRGYPAIPTTFSPSRDEPGWD